MSSLGPAMTCGQSQGRRIVTTTDCYRQDCSWTSSVGSPNFGVKVEARALLVTMRLCCDGLPPSLEGDEERQTANCSSRANQILANSKGSAAKVCVADRPPRSECAPTRSVRLGSLSGASHTAPEGHIDRDLRRLCSSNLLFLWLPGTDSNRRPTD
jgi:hypothetical protein